MQILQILTYVLMALIVLGMFIFCIAIGIALRSEDKERMSILIGHTIVGLVTALIALLIMFLLNNI